MSIFSKLKSIVSGKLKNVFGGWGRTSKINNYNRMSKVASKINNRRNIQRDSTPTQSGRSPVGDIIDQYQRKYSHISPVIFGSEYAKILMGAYGGAHYEHDMVEGFERYGVPLGFDNIKDWQLMLAIWNNLLNEVDWADYI